MLTAPNMPRTEKNPEPEPEPEPEPGFLAVPPPAAEFYEPLLSREPLQPRRESVWLRCAMACCLLGAGFVAGVAACNALV